MHNNTPKKCPTDIFFQLTAELQRKAESKDREKKEFWTQIYADKLRCAQKLKSRCQRLIKLGSRLRIEGFPKTVFRADDVGGAIKGKHIDLWFPRHMKAVEFGRQKLVVELVNNG